MKKLNKFLFITLTMVLPLTLSSIVFFAISDIYHGRAELVKVELWIGAGIGIAMWSLWIARVVSDLGKNKGKNDG